VRHKDSTFTGDSAELGHFFSSEGPHLMIHNQVLKIIGGTRKKWAPNPEFPAWFLYTSRAKLYRREQRQKGE